MASASLLIVEPFYGGSHKQLIDILVSRLDPSNYHLVTLPAKKWHWRARTSALKISQLIPSIHQFTTLFTSSVLSLAELLGMRPDLIQLRKVVYFHENQLVYPVKNVKERDFQFGYNQITTCLSADLVLFNSHYNVDSFISNIPSFLALQPDQRPNTKQICDHIKSIGQVSYFPLQLPGRNTDYLRPRDKAGPLHIVWPHRWEHDKDPETFCRVVLKLHESNCDFELSLLGEVFTEVPDIFQEVKVRLGDKIKTFGFLPSKEDYFALLRLADVVVSTAVHEFYGVSMLEAAWQGCYPLVPSRLAYQEIYPLECQYNTEQQLYKRLFNMCANPSLCDSSAIHIPFDKITGEVPLGNLLEAVTQHIT